MRWRVLLAAEKDIPTINVFWANMAGYLGNTILPARAGELIRAAYVSRENSIPASFSLATGLVERFIDLVALVILGSFSLSIAGILSKPLEGALKTISMIAVLGTLALLIAPYFGDKAHFLLNSLPVLGASTKEKLGGMLKQFLLGIGALHQPRRAFGFILFTCVIWLMDAAGTIILARSLHLEFMLSQAFLLLAGLGLSSAIPSTPGYVGVYQFVAVIVLRPFGISKANALAFIIFLQVANLLMIAFWGVWAAWRRLPAVQS